MKIAIVGGGVTGLVSAYLLSKAGHQVTIFEKEKTLGGLASSFKPSNWLWPLERFYHHFFTSDKAILSLIEELNGTNEIIFKSPKTSVFVEDKIYPFDNIKSILLFPKLNIKEKVQLAMATAFMKANPFWRPLERITAYSFIKKTMGEKNFEIIWKPLLDSKFGKLAPQIPASWFWTRIQKRSFKLGYLQGGIETLFQLIADNVKKNGGQIYLNQEVDKIAKTNNLFELTVNQKKISDSFDKVITSVSPDILAKMVTGLKTDQNFKSLGSVVLILELEESFLKDGTYWLNINDSSFPFVAVVEHTNFMDKKYYGGKIILYVGGYYSLDNPLFSDPNKKILDKFIPYLTKINQSFDFKNNLKNYWVFKEEYTQPIPSLNYSKDLPSIKTNITGLYWGSLHHVYPQDRGINYAILLGRKIFKEIEKTTAKN